MTNLDLWLEAMDFSKVRALSFPCSRDGSCVDRIVNDKLPSRLPRLESLAVVGAQAAEFMCALPPDTLRHVSWLQPDNNVDRDSAVPDGSERRFEALVRRQGASLKSLVWHTDESLSSEPAAGRSVHQLRLLATSAPNVTNLTLDIGRNGSWPLDELRAMASHPRPTSLTAYMDLASQCRREKPEDYSMTSRVACDCVGEAQYRQPLLNATTGVEVIKFLRDHKVGGALTHVALRSGEWSPPWHGPLYFPMWLEGRKTWFEWSCLGPGKEVTRTRDTQIDRTDERLCTDMSDPSPPDRGQRARGQHVIATGQQVELAAVQHRTTW